MEAQLPDKILFQGEWKELYSNPLKSIGFVEVNDIHSLLDLPTANAVTLHRGSFRTINYF